MRIRIKALERLSLLEAIVTKEKVIAILTHMAFV
jgi:hypothetical protein